MKSAADDLLAGKTVRVPGAGRHSVMCARFEHYRNPGRPANGDRRALRWSGVTTCRVYLDDRLWGRGAAVCQPGDTFSRGMGRLHALKAALVDGLGRGTTK